MDGTDASQVETAKRRSVRSANDHDQAIAAVLREARRRKGISQPQMASRIGCTFQQVQKYESGRNRIPGARLLLIARALNMDIVEFFGDLPARSSDPTLQAEELRFIRAYRSITAKQARSLDAFIAALEGYHGVQPA